ncbi:hypothetical protein P1J78_07875 [Psychromarinibacter sp. C21-152]|uniref:Cation transport ATPase n=1 Tax=Psychromarinibacter sediminicola TaxID=3033385 RepID=A0AAE3NNM2_9RHOB|nr:hypothetical protein [Psychromarinibacter sediminicola]MDF0600643.1 hypothetical protein [Psychromarinibacter sediminicola]
MPRTGHAPPPRNRARAAVAGLAVLGLAACGGFGLSRPPETVAVAGGDVVIGGPQGYCIDRPGSRLTGESPFVLLGSCASIARDAGADAPRQPGVLTATVSAPGEGPGFAETVPQLESFLSSAPGRAALARDGRPESVEVLSTRRDGAALIIHLRDTSANVVPGTDPTYWRGLFEANGRLVTVSVMSFADQPMGSDLALATLRGMVARIRQETAARHAPAPTQEEAG